MRESRAICLLCQFRASRRAASGAGRHTQPQWTHSARLYSTESLASDRAAEAPSENPPAVTFPRRDGRAVLEATSTFGKLRDRLRPSTRNSSDIPNDATQKKLLPKVRGARSLEIFEEVLHNQKEDVDAEPWQPKVGMVLYQHLTKLDEIRKNNQGQYRPQAFDYFEEHIYPELLRHKIRELPTILIKTARDVLSEVTEAKIKNYESTAWPTVTQITLMRRQLAIMEKPESWVPLILGLVDCVRKISTTKTDYSGTNEYDEAQNTRRSLLKDLIASWRMFSIPEMFITNQGVLNDAAQFRIPLINDDMLRRAGKRGNITAGLATIFNRYSPSALESLPRAVIPTFVLLTDPVQCEDTFRTTAKEFLSAVGRITAQIPFSGKEGMRRFLNLDDGLFEYVWRRYEDLKEVATMYGQAKKNLYLTSRQVRYDARSAKATTPKDSLAIAVHQRLSQVFRARDVKACEQVWTTFWGPDAVPSSERAEKLRNMESEFNYFIMVFTSLRKTSRGIDVLGCMAKIGLSPSLKSWTSFIEGCRRAMNSGAIHNIWEKLVASGIELDTTIWTARISGLIQSGEPEAGLRALHEMLTKWNEAVRAGKPETAVKPTIEAVNVAIAGLLRLGDSAAAQKVLSWAGTHNIAPDVVTYNTLLGPLARDGREAAINNMLAVMQKQGVQPDTATFTILMDVAMSRIDATDPKLRIDAIESILTQMQSAGIKPSAATYAKMIYLLLQDGDSKTVSAVLTHIEGTGRQLSPHIQTMLVEHFFSKNPPDLESADKIVLNCKLHDNIFWERVVRGYAQVRDTEQALKCYRRVENSSSLAMSTLEDLLQALIVKEEWDEARALARKVKAQRDPGDGFSDPDSRYLKHRFWHLVMDYNLLANKPANEVGT